MNLELSTLTFLVVDDSAYMRTILRTMLQGFGARRIVEAEDGASGLEAMDRANPDILILDWVMPGIGGPGFCDAARHIARVKPMPPIVVITAHATRRVVTEAIRAGVDQILVKPFSATSLRDRLMSAIENKPTAEPAPSSGTDVFFL